MIPVKNIMLTKINKRCVNKKKKLYLDKQNSKRLCFQG